MILLLELFTVFYWMYTCELYFDRLFKGDGKEI